MAVSREEAFEILGLEEGKQQICLRVFLKCIIRLYKRPLVVAWRYELLALFFNCL